jgi:hypothetical protein
MGHRLAEPRADLRGALKAAMLDAPHAPSVCAGFAPAQGRVSSEGAQFSHGPATPPAYKEPAMSVFKDLFTSDVGLMSAAVLAITLGMGAFYVRYFLRHIASDSAAAQKPN